MAASDSRRPRLSLQIKSAPGPNIRSTRTSLANGDPKSPTAFNTLSNVYVTAIERSTPVQSTPVTAIKLHQPLKLQTDPASLRGNHHRIQTPFTAALPDTPLSANPISPAQQMEIVFPSTMTATPPLSAGPVEASESRAFTFASSDTNKRSIPSSPVQSRRQIGYGSLGRMVHAPYSHNRSLHSILRNSPLPPPSAGSPISPRRQSLRLQEKAARRVGYESPLTQEIHTEKYTRSHIDLLAEDASPYTPSPAVEDSDMVIDLAMAYSGDETRDGGQTPGPFEEMRRQMAGLNAETPVLSPRSEGVKKRKRKEKKRRWVWTIGQDEDENEGGAVVALRAAVAAADASTPRLRRPAPKAIPEPVTAVQISVEEPADSDSDVTGDRMDIEMSDSSSMMSSRATTPYSVDLDMLKTPTVAAPNTMNLHAQGSGSGGVQQQESQQLRFGSVDFINSDTGGSRGDTPIPPELVH
ncbi:hypothetical protein F4778DRAFT_764641 [Xylariomycetidae sp. FL2044]|nr:hypothetical protein F4778DRAFT_764641 [Xylariomycetidae sp. FL2044]